jgi:hypothetical protein
MVLPALNVDHTRSELVRDGPALVVLERLAFNAATVKRPAGEARCRAVLTVAPPIKFFIELNFLK